MTDTKITIMENIFSQMIAIIGYEKANEILNSTKPIEVIQKTETPKKKDEVVKEKTKRISRMTPTITTMLNTELTNVGLTINKVELDKLKKEFSTYVDDLNDNDFTAQGLSDHMRSFANTKKPVDKNQEIEQKTVNVEQKPKKAGKKKEEIKKNEDICPSSDRSVIHSLTLNELQSIGMLATLTGEPTGVYWDAVNGRWIKGPDEANNEDVVDVMFKNINYVVGEETGRVYKGSDTGGPDKFLGFVGVSLFQDMKMP